MDSRSITSAINGKLGGRPKKIDEEFYIDGEIWKFIDGHSRYMVSNKGRILSTKHGTSFLYRCVKKNGYVNVLITEKGKQMTKLVHRFVAKAFIPNPEGKPQVDHINGDKTDNRVENLRWAYPHENARSYSHKREKTSSKYRGVSWDKSRKKWRACVELNNKSHYAGRFKSEADAALAYNKKALDLGFNKECLNVI